MKALLIYYKNEVVFDRLTEEQVNTLLQKGIIEKTNNRYELKENVEFKHLFNPNIYISKRLKYFERLNEKRLICEDCGKPYSFHIRPLLENDGSINFKKIVCVCKECRSKFLENHDITVAQFKKDFSTTALVNELRTEFYSKFKDFRFVDRLIRDKRLVDMMVAEKRLYGQTKIVLPPIPSDDLLYEQARMAMEQVLINLLGENVDYSDQKVRVVIRKYLLGECYGKCPCCGEQLTMDNITIDHIVAKSKGGKNSILNFIGLCYNCNQEKDTKPVLEILLHKEFKALPARVLKIALEEQQNCKERLNVLQNEIKKYLKSNYSVDWVF